jgi:DNA-binding MarR family transcriptional regulator
MFQYADLELGLHNINEHHYKVEMRFTQPNSDADIRMGLKEQISFRLEILTLQHLITDPSEYGKTLSDILFADANMLSGWQQARTSAQTLGVPLRIRLLIGSNAPELNALYWEALADPNSKSPLFTGENVLIARYLSSNDWRPVKLRSKGALKALTVAANPSDLTNYHFTPIDVVGELGRVKDALGNIPVTELPGNGGNYATIDNIIQNLREGCDILYVVAHGTVVNGSPFLWLETGDGKVARLHGDDFVTRLSELAQPPRLIVLASCESAGNGAGNAFQTLGPKLAEAGIPAVLAMQGRISMNTIKKFMPVFFTELKKDGQIDRALAVARGMVRGQNDFWMPVLFMRLKSGKIWSDDKQEPLNSVKLSILKLFQDTNISTSNKLSLDTIAQHLNLSVKVTQVHLDDFVKRGWVTSEPRRAHGSLISYFYEITSKGIEILEKE